MKEFIEKLIGRLEEEHERCINRYGIVGGNAPAMEVKQCMEIVNELAEEYKHCALCYLGSPCEYQNEYAMLPNELLADENGWIPVSERLPEEDGVYIISFEECSGLICCAVACFLLNHPKCKWWDLESEYERYETVVAWMPLPEPFKPIAK